GMDTGVACEGPRARIRGGGTAGALPLVVVEIGGGGSELVSEGNWELGRNGLPCGVFGRLRSFWMAAVTEVSVRRSKSSTLAVSSSSVGLVPSLTSSLLEPESESSSESDFGLYTGFSSSDAVLGV